MPNTVVELKNIFFYSYLFGDGNEAKRFVEWAPLNGATIKQDNFVDHFYSRCVPYKAKLNKYHARVA